jgi:hypothetical protein
MLLASRKEGMKMTAEKLVTEYGALKNDFERWRYILNHKNLLGVMLDNDNTQVIFIGDIIKSLNEDEIDELPELVEMDTWLGWSNGVVTLLAAIGIKAELV